jgi:prepilin-type N-terminal cleavage/methylation domain-containing protein
MKIFRDRTGFTIIELMIVVAIIGFVTAMAIPSMRAYQRKEATRGTAQKVSGVVTDARSQAMANGRMTFLLLGEPTNGLFPFEEGQFASVVTDANGNSALDETDTASPVYLAEITAQKVESYDADSSSYQGSLFIPDEDLSERVPISKLNDLQDGTTFPMADGVGVPAVAFSPQGAPVGVNTPDQWGTGAGGIYLTDDESMVLAVLVMPLGEVKIKSLDAASGEWK